MPETILDLKTLAPELADDRPVVRIDDVDYPMAMPMQFSIHELLRIEAMQERIMTLLREEEKAGPGGDAQTPEREKVVSGIYDALLKVILPSAPAEVIGGLADAQRLQVVWAFTAVLAVTKRTTKAKPAQKTRPSKKRR